MSVQPPPTKDASIFNPSYFGSTTEGVTIEYVDLNYLKKAGGQTVVAEETFTGGILTNSITPSSGNDISMASSGTAEAITVTVDNLNASMIVECNYLQVVTQTVTNELFCTTATASQGLTAGNVTVSGALAGTLSTAAQPNITSVGTLTSLSVSGTATLANISTSNLNGYNPSTELAKLSNNTIANVNETTITGALLVTDSALSVPAFDGSSNTFGAFTTSSSSDFSSLYLPYQAVRPATLNVYWNSSANKYPSSGGVYTGTTTTAGYAGEWWQLAATYLFSLTSVQITNSAYSFSTNCKTFYVLGSTDVSSWTLLGSGSLTTAVNITNPTYRMYYVRIVITETSVQGVTTSCFIPHINFSGRVAEGTCNIKGNATFQANVNVSGATTLANITCGNLSASGASSVTTLTCSGNITQSGTTTANLRTLNVSTASNLTGNVGITGNLSVSGNITTYSSLPINPWNYAAFYTANNTLTNRSFTVPSTARCIKVLFTDVKTTGTNIPYIYLSSSSGTPTCGGWTIGNNAAGRSNWGPSVPAHAWNTDANWSSTAVLQSTYEFVYSNTTGGVTTYSASGHGYRSDSSTIYNMGFYGTFTIPNGGSLNGVVVTTNSTDKLVAGTIFVSYQ